MHNEVCIRPYRKTDIDAIYDAARESIPEIAPWMPWCHAGYSRNETVAWVESRQTDWDAKVAFSFVIETENGRVLGSCGLNRIELENGTANLGYWVRTSATRQGVATRAVGLLQAWAFANTELHRLEIMAAVDNITSQQVALKSGATREAILKQRLLLHGCRHDVVLFSIIREVKREHLG